MSVVDEVTDRIALEIATGARAPGDRLPSVRALAAAHGINPSTVQIVLARLRAAGFVDASFIVRDIELYGGIDTWRYLFRFAQQMPERATRLFENFLGTRRVLVLEVCRAIAERKGGVDLRDLRRAIERLEDLARANATPEELARAEVQAARVFMQKADQPVLLALYNTVADILLTVPAVRGAMYAEPEFNVRMWRSLVERWEQGSMAPGDLEIASSALSSFHVVCVDRFRRLLREQPGAASTGRRRRASLKA